MLPGELPSGAAPIEEMQRLAIRNESAHWRRYNIGPGAYRPELRENVSALTQAHVLLHGDETAAIGDAGYQGVRKRPENVGKAVKWRVAMKRSKRKALPNNKLGCMIEKLKHVKARVRTKVKHSFDVIKNLFRHRKSRYRELAKNTAELFTLFGFANLVLAGQRFNVTENRVVP